MKVHQLNEMCYNYCQKQYSNDKQQKLIFFFNKSGIKLSIHGLKFGEFSRNKSNFDPYMAVPIREELI